MNEDQTKAMERAQGALGTFGVIRVTLGKVPLGYRLLQKAGLVTARRVPGHPDKADMRLKP